MAYNYPYSSIQYSSGMQSSQFVTQSNYEEYPSQLPYPVNSTGDPTASNSEHAEPSSSNTMLSNNAKKKRKATVSDDEIHDTGPSTDQKKRTKTTRACDSCRSRKIRCDIIPDSDPHMCKHCNQYGFECTFFLPITETRFKRRKTDEDGEKPHTSAPRPVTNGRTDAAFQRPSSPELLTHSHPITSSRIYDAYDLKYHHSYEISLGTDGMIHVAAPEESPLSMPASLDPRVERETVEELLNSYFKHVAPDFPVVLCEEFLSNPKPDPMLLYSMCLVAAARREVRPSVFEAIRHAVNLIIKVKDVLSTPTLSNVQSLLILSMCADCHSQFVSSALSAVWIRLGAAIRMAQDIGLHRSESSRENIEVRRRVWAACMVADRWASVTFGRPSMISVEDCDSGLPCSERIEDKYISQLVRLSLLVGRIDRAMYGPAGLKFTSDEILQELLTDLEDFKLRLPPPLHFSGPSSTRHAGLLQLFYSCASMLFWRAFLGHESHGLGHLKFHLAPERWSVLTANTGEAIKWLDKNDHCYDTWMTVAYAAVSCALAQYHTYIRLRDDTSEGKLRVLRDMVKRWETLDSTEHMSSRRKMAEIITLLYEATQRALNTSPQNTPNAHHPRAPPETAENRGDSSSSNPSAKRSGKVEEAATNPTPGTHTQTVMGVDADLLSSSAFAPPLPAGSSVSEADLAVLFGNVNPVMNSTKPTTVPVLSTPQTAPTTMNPLDIGWLQGMPATLWNFPQWDQLFSRFDNPSQASTNETPTLT